jgi:LuxR family maltose regulon positive regulatory protein
MPEAAVVYGHAAGELGTLAGLVEALGFQLYYDGRMEIVEEWLGWFSEDELRQYPALAVIGAWFRVLTGRPADAERCIALAEGTTSTVPLSDGSATVEPWLAVLRGSMMRHGAERALADAGLALDQLPPDSAWIPDALNVRGLAHRLLGADADAVRDFEAAADRAAAIGTVDIAIVAQAQLALLAARRGDWDKAGQRARAAQAQVDEAGFGDYAPSSIAHVATASVAHHEGRHEDARVALTRAHRLRPFLGHGLPGLTVVFGVELARVHLALGEAAAARTVLSETEQVLALRPDLGSLVGEFQELRDRVAASVGPAGAWAMSLTGAEIRLLPYLATHLTFPEIATRLFISRNTVKTEAVSIYRKLGASSRSQAIERAVEVGFLESSTYPPRANLIPDG